MFLQHANKLGFLKLDPESQVFMVFPIAARKTLAQTTVTCLLNLDPHPDKITTASHMRSLMEIVGQAFDLPFEGEDGTAVVASALDVYKLWLCNATYQPAPVREDPEFFTSRMLRHISLVFRPRPTAVDRHVAIGRKALDVYVQVAKEAGPFFSESTWCEFLKLFLAIADSLLSQPLESVPLADRLQAHVLRVLFEIWIMSRCQDEDVWAIWKMLMANWRHRIATITSWTAVLFGLVHRVLGITYGDTVGSPNLSFTIGEVPVVLEPDPEHAMYLMFKVLHIVGELESISDPGIYNEAMRGLAFLASSMINVQNKMRNLNMVVLDGNTLLHMLGPMLLEALTKYPKTHDHGKATALEAVTKLFLRKAVSTDFDLRYLAMFYHGLEGALKSGSPYLLSVAMLNCQRLFGASFKGVNMLMPSFVVAVTNILSSRAQLQGLHGTMSMLRRSSLNMMMQLICWPNLYGKVALNARDVLRCDVDLPAIQQYEDLTPYLRYSLMHSLEVLEQQNFSLLFHVAFLFAMEHFDDDVAFARDFIQEILQVLLARKWDNAGMLDALRFLDDMAVVAEKLGRATQVNVSVVQALCALLMDVNDVNTTQESIKDELSCAALHCIRRWSDGPWVLKDRELLQKVWLTLSICLSGVTGFHFPSERIQDAASSTAHHYLARLGLSTDPEFLCTTTRERDVFSEFSVSEADTFCFVLDGNIFSVVNHPKQPNLLHCSVFVRSPSGVSSWRMALNYFPQEIVVPAPFGDNGSELLPSLPPTVTLSEEVMRQMSEVLSNEQAALQTDLEIAVNEHVMRLDDIRRSIVEGASEMQALSRLEAKPVPDGQWENVAVRMFASTMGFLSPVFIGRTHVLPASRVSAAMEFFQRLDTLPVAETYKVGLAYVARSGPTEENPDAGSLVGSPLFESFLKGLGNTVRLDRHPELELDPALVGEEFLLATDPDVSLCFLSRCWMPMDEERQEEQLTLLGDLDVMVCWAEDADEVKQRGRAVYTICIEPLPCGLYRIRVMMKSGVFLAGPLVDGALVSGHVLPCALVRTIINMSRAAKEGFVYGQSHSKRKILIEEFIRDQSGVLSITQSWATVFSREGK